ncbi:hypothetical protein EW145_g6223 [Phellinidium pouzarii]|uniref:Alcohol acetyltransferase n=1 Tax=Phellinidium pouzarii TaxID=167371 RepID=A0A4S4KZ27_9AGAM|nr:hypothetical protein EW145_g6223 [Phellinidium pouzarii]
MSIHQLYRPAGLLERYHITRQSLRFDSPVVVAGKYINVVSNERLSPETVYPAVVHAIHTHAALSALILHDPAKGSRPFFCRMQTINVEQAVRFLNKDDGDLGSLIEVEMSNRIDVNGNVPLWRLTVTSDNVVIFAWHHGIGDGQSGPAVLRTILEGLNKTEQSSSPQDFKAITVPKELSMTPAVEDLTNVSPSICKILGALASIFVPPSWANRNVWTGKNVLPSVPTTTKTNIRIIRIPLSSAAHLLSSARAHKATLTSLLYTLIVPILSKLLLSQPDSRKYKRLSISVPVSLRPLAHVPATAMCELVSAYQPFPAFCTEFSWERAAAFADELHQAVPPSRQTIGTLKLLFGHYEAYFKGHLGAKRKASLELSNIGAFKTAHTGGEPQAEDDAPRWRVGDTYFAQCDVLIGAPLQVFVTGSPDGGVNICVTWSQGLEDTMAEAFVKGLQIAIEDLSRHK